MASTPGFVAPYLVVAVASKGPLTDQLFLVLAVVNWLALAFGSSLESSFVKYFTDTSDNQHAWRATRRALLKWSGLISLAAGIVSGLTLSSLTKLPVAYLVLTVLLPCLITTSSVLSAACYARSVFVRPQLLGSLRSLLLILIALVLREEVGATSLAIAILVGEFLRFSLLWTCARVDLVPAVPTEDVCPKLRLGQMLTSSASVVVFATSPLIDKSIAAHAQVGGITTLELAEKLLYVPLTVINVAIGAVLVAGWSRQLSSGRTQEFFADYKKVQARLILASTVLACVMAGAFFGVRSYSAGVEGLDLVREGSFAACVLFYLLGLPAAASNNVSARAVQILGGSKYLLQSAILGVVVNLGADIVGLLLFGIPGIALSSTVTRCCVALMVYRGVRKLATPPPTRSTFCP